MIRRSVQLNEGDELPYDPFALDQISDSLPTLFEIQFIKGDVLYRYGFEYTRKEIVSEWLYEKRFGEKEYELFVRSHDLIDVSPKRFSEGIGKEDLTNSNRLFLSLVAQLKGEKSNSVMGFRRLIIEGDQCTIKIDKRNYWVNVKMHKNFGEVIYTVEKVRPNDLIKGHKKK